MTNQEIVHLWIEAFNAHDTESILNLYDADAEHFSPKLKIKKPETKGFICGKEAMRIWWNEAFENIPSLNYELYNTISEGNQILFEYIRSVEGEPQMNIAELFVLKDNLIISSKVYHG